MTTKDKKKANTMKSEEKTEEPFRSEDGVCKESLAEQETLQETCMAPVGAVEKKQENPKLDTLRENKHSFMHGLFVGLGIGCIAAFTMLWITVFFAPKLPTSVTYEVLLSMFIYPLIYLLGIGLIALTAGIVREYFVTKSKV